MLISPAVLGLIAGLVMFARTEAPPNRLVVLLAVVVTWFFGYFAFFAFGLATRARNPQRRAKYLKPVYVYGTVSLAGITAALLLQPELMWWALPFAPLVMIAVGETNRGRSRSTLSGVSTLWLPPCCTRHWCQWVQQVVRCRQQPGPRHCF